MSLKAFHILFIIVSTLLAVFVGGWGVLDYRRSGDGTHLIVGIASLLSGILLIWYSIWFVRKLKGLSSS